MSISEDLGYQAEWRQQKGVEYPDDQRNVDAATLLEKLEKEVRALEDRNDPLVDRVNRVLQQGGSGFGFVEGLQNYHRQIGFCQFPSSGEEYLNDVIELAASS